MEVKLILCADSASVDIRHNTFSAFHILEELGAASFPFVLPRLSVIAILERRSDEPPNPEIQLIITLDEQQLFVGPYQANFFNRLTARAIAELQGLVIAHPGTLQAKLIVHDVELGHWTMLVRQATPPGMQTYPAAPSSSGV